MLRQTVRSFGALSLTLTDNSLPAAQLSRSISFRSKSDNNGTEDEIDHVVKWSAGLKSKPIPENVAFFTYSKSSGPGGQHVNRFSVSIVRVFASLLTKISTKSKATLSLPMDTLKRHSPRLLHEHFQRHRNYVKNSHSLVVHSKEERSQHENKRNCWRKLYEIFQDIAEKHIRSESSIDANGNKIVKR